MQLFFRRILFALFSILFLILPQGVAFGENIALTTQWSAPVYLPSPSGKTVDFRADIIEPDVLYDGLINGQNLYHNLSKVRVVTIWEPVRFIQWRISSDSPVKTGTIQFETTASTQDLPPRRNNDISIEELEESLTPNGQMKRTLDALVQLYKQWPQNRASESMGFNQPPINSDYIIISRGDLPILSQPDFHTVNLRILGLAQKGEYFPVLQQTTKEALDNPISGRPRIMANGLKKNFFGRNRMDNCRT